MSNCKSKNAIFMDRVRFTYGGGTSISPSTWAHKRGDIDNNGSIAAKSDGDWLRDRFNVACASLRVSGGETLAVMGASGSGKSTLCYILAGLAPRYTGGKIRGVVRVAGHNVVAEAPAVGDVGVLFQDAVTQLFNATVEDEIAWGLEAMAVPPTRIGARVHEALEHFGLLGLERRPPWALSGGQQKRLALAALWAMRPWVLLLDEPLGGLDPKGREEILAVLRQVQQAGTSLLWTTLRPQMADLAEAVALLDGGQLTPPAPASDVLGQEDRLVQAGILYPQSRWPHFEGQSACRLRGRRGASPAVEVRGLSFGYPGGELVLHNINITIMPGEFLALVGPNGAGKTTLVRHFNGLLRPTSGAVRILGEEVGQRPVGDLARDVGFLFQRPEQQIFGTTVRDEVAYGLRKLHASHGWHGDDCERTNCIRARVARALERFGLTELADVPPAILSYGMQRSVTLAALTALDTPILVLDEPTVGLDGHGWAQFLDWLAERHAAGVTIVVVTHEMTLASCANRIVMMQEGAIIAEEMPKSLSHPNCPSEPIVESLDWPVSL
jgi:energy-coupling factor transport system ATP-binding protein